ncbi:MAG: glycosyltransferase family 2 protein [Clostridia bacterium]|nr:glycosyltransferase family 2 protein [Clostridia bacterium]
MTERVDISVIVPCYNAHRYLNVCLESLRAQKQPQIEMILIDDGSTDSTGAMLDAFALAEPRARVIHTPNGGVSAARNRGIALATGRYLAFMDADDALEEDGLFLLYQAAVHSGAQIVSANHTLFDMEKGCRVPVMTEPVVQQPLEIVREIIHMHRIYNNLWNKLYVRELFEGGLSLDEGVRIGEDALMNLQLYLRAKKVHHLSEATYVYRVHGQSAMATIKGHCQAHLPMLRAMDRILRNAGVKELFFRDYLQSSVWIFEKESGILASMKRFNGEIRPYVIGGIIESRIAKQDERLYALVKRGLFPAFYLLMRIREKLIGKKWGIRR